MLENIDEVLQRIADIRKEVRRTIINDVLAHPGAWTWEDGTAAAGHENAWLERAAAGNFKIRIQYVFIEWVPGWWEEGKRGWNKIEQLEVDIDGLTHYVGDMDEIKEYIEAFAYIMQVEENREAMQELFRMENILIESWKRLGVLKG